MKKSRKSEKKIKKKLERELNKLWRMYILERADSKCEVCQTTGVKLDCHHIITRKVKILKWDTENGVYLCIRHHLWGKESAHEGGAFFTRWLMGKVS